jgi:hypothetical protein
MKRLGVGGAFLTAVACAGCLTGCSSSHHTSPATTTSSPRAGVYRVDGTAVGIAFPGSPGIERDPPPLTAILPKDTSVTAWNIGDVGSLKNDSYELVMATFPPGSTTTTIDNFLSGYASAPNSTMFGAPTLHELSAIPFSTGTRYSGITAFNVGRVLVMAVAFDSVRTDVARFLGSLQLVSPH